MNFLVVFKNILFSGNDTLIHCDAQTLKDPSYLHETMGTRMLIVICMTENT